MIIRGLLGLAVVALLLPHEPDLGFGRPASAATIAPSEDWTGRDARQSGGGCGGREGVCDQAAGLLAELQAVSLRSVDTVKADIAEAQRTRSHTRRASWSMQDIASRAPSSR